MKKFSKFLIAVLAVIMLLAFNACGSVNKGNDEDPGNDPGITDPSNPSDPGGDEPEPGEGDVKYTPRKKQEMPVAEVVDKDYDYGSESTWAGDKYSSLDLGYVYLQDVVDDNVYDWGHTVIKEDGKYRMWWVRPAVYDAIFYAESTDLKNWTNVQRVISYSPNSANIKKYTNMKGMLGKPSVVHVGDTYFMYFEAPASEDPDVSATVLEWDNQVMLATSKDGINWDMYGESDPDGQPKPVVAMPADMMGDVNNKHYGAGQPSVFYKDGEFYLTYCYVTNNPYSAGIFLAKSSDGYNFGDRSTHTRISGGNGLGFTYNTLTGKYMMCSSDRVVENDSMDFTQKVLDRDGNLFYEYDSSTIQTSFAEFVKNPHGLIDTHTFYIIHLQGTKSTTDDWRAGYPTWDGYIHAVNPKEFEKRTITLPNGGAATENNIKAYRNRANSYSRPTANAIYAQTDSIKIDGMKDEIYDKSDRIDIMRPVYNYGSNFTDTWAQAWVAWNEEYLFVYAQVYDNNIDNSYSITSAKHSYMRDSLDVFLDVVNDHPAGLKEVSWGDEQYMICTGSNNADFMIKAGGEKDDDVTDMFEKPRHTARRMDFGYTIELRIPWWDAVLLGDLEDYIYEGACIGMDFQINDAMGGKVGREAMVVWSDHRGESFRFVDGMGDVYLIKE